jgi:hypothetical protein
LLTFVSAGESGEDEYIEREEYPLCQPAYDSEDLSYSEGTIEGQLPPIC